MEEVSQDRSVRFESGEDRRTRRKEGWSRRKDRENKVSPGGRVKNGDVFLKKSCS